ncbi:MAG: acetoacetate--CoA ligase, partial [Aeromicrobium sp.]
LFVVLVDGLSLDDDVRRTIATALRTQLSPRHMPDVIHQVHVLPRTLSGKKLEVPAKKILQGTPVEAAVAKGALTNPHALDEFVRIRDEHRDWTLSAG